MKHFLVVKLSPVQLSFVEIGPMMTNAAAPSSMVVMKHFQVVMLSPIQSSSVEIDPILTCKALNPQ